VYSTFVWAVFCSRPFKSVYSPDMLILLIALCVSCRLLLPEALLTNYEDISLVTFQVFTVVVIKVKVTLRPTVSRPVLLGVRHPSGTRDQFFFFLEIFFRQLRGCYFVAPSLTRGRTCNLLLLLVLLSVVPLGSALSDERPGLPFVSIRL
jgi:hypothetical protein